MERCADCYFFREGQCRKTEPKLFMRDTGCGTFSVDSCWPPVSPDLWCGEFKPKAEAKASESREPMKLRVWIVRSVNGGTFSRMTEKSARQAVNDFGGTIHRGTWTEETP